MDVRVWRSAALAVTCLWAAIGCQHGVTSADIKKVSAVELQSLLDKAGKPGKEHGVLLIDPRGREEFTAGHLPGAMRVALADVPEGRPLDPMIERAASVVVYGNNPASAVAQAMTKRLIAVGRADARFFPGGVEEWKKRGGALEQGE